jgi:hypothetical protein
MYNNVEDWIDPRYQLPKVNEPIYILYNNTETITGYLERDGQWVEYGGRRLDQGLVSGWKEKGDPT